MALCTQDQVEQLLQINFGSDTDATVAQYVAFAGQIIKTYIGFDPELDDAITENHDPTYSSELWVEQPPIRDVTSVTIDGVALTESDTAGYLFYESGLLFRTGGIWSSDPQGIAVVYKGGYATVPPDISYVCALLAARMFQAGAAAAVGGDAGVGIKSLRLDGSDSVTYQDSVSDIGTMPVLTENEMMFLDPYRRGTVGV